MANEQLSIYYVVSCVLKYRSFQEAKIQAPEQIATHIRRSKELHSKGTLLMAGAFLDRTEEPLSTMGVLISHAAAEEYLEGDPFYLGGMMSQWSIREWANLYA